MSIAPEVFRFAVIRSPQAVTTKSDTDLPTMDDLGGQEEARRLAKQVEKKYSESADSDASIASVIGSDDPRHVLVALLRFGRSATLLNKLAKHLKEQGGAVSVTDERGGPLIVRGELIGRRGSVLPDSTPDLERKPHFGPVGVGDLKVVEQHLLRYEPGEIAHIENVLESEERTREHTLVTERELVVSEELEQSEYMEQDLKTAERFELQTSARDEISQRSKLEAGLNVTASYGPTVEVEASLDYSRENSRQAARERASNFAQEVTEHAVRRTEEKMSRKREERSRTSTEHVNTHKFVNTGPEAKNITGIYRYVDKVYQMKLVNRGVRFFYEFIVPTPGAFLREMARQAPTTQLKEPRKPSERVTSITASSYPGILQKYQLGGIAPPPAGKVVVTEFFSNRDTGDSGAQRFLKEGSLTIPADYMAKRAKVSIIAWRQHRTDPEMELVLGEKEISFSGQTGTSRHDDIRRDPPLTMMNLADLGDQRESIGYVFFAQHDSTVQVKMEVTCVPTPESLREWQHGVYDAIIDDYRSRLSEYHAALQEETNAAAVTLDVELPPQVLRKREQDELKRLCLQLMGQEADLADPLHEGGTAFVMEEGEAPLEEGETLIDVDKLSSLSREIRFAEQAFEWVNMTYTLYPYYWADETEWEELLG
ncbi:MAG: hypothetical protein HKN15_07610, partial [Xanthomonadales bacterium]|nr:hypothetical protein [Xanthomonadales bacterium]